MRQLRTLLAILLHLSSPDQPFSLSPVCFSRRMERFAYRTVDWAKGSSVRRNRRGFWPAIDSSARSCSHCSSGLPSIGRRSVVCRVFGLQFAELEIPSCRVHPLPPVRYRQALPVPPPRKSSWRLGASWRMTGWRGSTLHLPASRVTLSLVIIGCASKLAAKERVPAAKSRHLL